MSYAAEVKKELTGLIVHGGNAKAELSALMRMNGVSTLGLDQSIRVQTENAAIARRIYTLLKQSYDNVEVEVTVSDHNHLSRHKSYGVLLKSQIDDVLNDLGVDPFGLHPEIPSRLLNQVDKKRSFLRGAFLATGSVNSPEKANYHLEIYTTHEELGEQLLIMMSGFDLPAKMTDRGNGFIVYLKRAEKIVDFLQTIGATQSMLRFEDIRMMRDMRNSVNRLVNAETANMQKTAIAANKQVSQIQTIAKQIGGLDFLPQKLREVAQARLDNPDESLAELGEMLEISKSGVNHRMRKLKQLAEMIEAGEAYDLTKL
ncbi:MULTISPECIES: DNA-binding protein WhiA [Leuconostoc]|jgi:cell division protein WhiA|uniref:Probable cell division protein WhiA n=1 Tax=Leuconostoc pseudomesenteroides TaxID=33968 RepID=A0A5B8SX65_LEUPS|nr:MULTISPECIES: DNA-binding protein WhiA [Leuconostoc]MBK0041237.1 DNA-binding protein WhiA [Leuconostoc sp. S51]MBK0052186.1 DNA-binding protein WhiA [Leuconostoc sp. S50]MBS0957925.1 DNA-binding protein WhiA [Leuconostoc pseudomesenteroides]MCC7668550.1 DNA-binding protein WhiA [Leuconostoc pseudomesenteroides]MCC8439933.1 DNA-binding protein WhiA [Leuconostoc pseudomesenteroides]